MENDNENVKWVTEWRKEERKWEWRSIERKQKWMRNEISVLCMQCEYFDVDCGMRACVCAWSVSKNQKTCIHHPIKHRWHSAASSATTITNWERRLPPWYERWSSDKWRWSERCAHMPIAIMNMQFSTGVRARTSTNIYFWFLFLRRFFFRFNLPVQWKCQQKCSELKVFYHWSRDAGNHTLTLTHIKYLFVLYD